MTNKIYIHETINVTVAKRRAYLDHFTDVWAPRSRELNELHCFGVWGTNGSTGAWPEAILMWELDGYEAFSRMMSAEFAHLTDDHAAIGDHYDMYWASAPDGVVDKDGFDRVLAPTPATPSLDEAIAAGIKGAIYYHQIVTVRPGAVDDYLERHDAEWRPIAENHGLVFVGSYRTMLRNDSEAVVLWALPDHALFERVDTTLRTDPKAREFVRSTSNLGVDWVGKVLVGAPANPLDTGRRL